VTKKKYIIAFIVILILIPVIVASLLMSRRQHKTQQINITRATETSNLQNQQQYQIEDTSLSPQSPEAVTNGAIIREIQANSSSLQRFVIKSAVDGSIREIFEVNENDIKFENIMQQNWSPSNRFVYIYIDYPKRRDVIFIKTDGRFTNAQYFLHSTGLYPDMNVLNAKWLNENTLQLQTTNIKTLAPQNYTVNFDDDTGVVMPETIKNQN
jgi:hypothetical protein